jgi:hypothetical protein
MTPSLAAEQLTLFSKTSLNPIPELKRMMRLAIKESGLSRPEVADRMSNLAEIEGMGRDISSDALQSWLKNEADRHIPIELLVIFCRVTGSIQPLQAFLLPLSAAAVQDRDLAALELGRAVLLKRKAAQKERAAILKLEMEA